MIAPVPTDTQGYPSATPILHTGSRDINPVHQGLIAKGTGGVIKHTVASDEARAVKL